MSKVRMTRAAYFLIAAMALLVAAGAGAADWQQAALAAAAPYIDRANDDWTRAILKGDAAVLSAPYDENGIFIRSDGTAVRGKNAVRDMYAKRRAGVTVLKASIKSDGRAAHDPADVYEWGTASTTIRRGKAVTQSSGRYLTVWHREGNRWLITRNIAF
jgi:ketosteroid isomerase-like protein